MKLTLSVLEDVFTIHRFPPDQDVPKQVFEEKFVSICKTDDELSIVCSSSILLDSESHEDGWSCIKVLGPLDFSLTGILADISTVLAKAKISIFAISSFDTDYILVKSETLQAAKTALQKAAFVFQ